DSPPPAQGRGLHVRAVGEVPEGGHGVPGALSFTREISKDQGSGKRRRRCGAGISRGDEALARVAPARATLARLGEHAAAVQGLLGSARSSVAPCERPVWCFSVRGDRRGSVAPARERSAGSRRARAVAPLFTRSHSPPPAR